MTEAGRKFAVFDIDGTIIRTALFLQVVDELIVRGHLPGDVRASLDTKLEGYRSRTHRTAFQEYNETAVRALFDNLTTIKVSDYRSAVDDVVKHSYRRVYTYTRGLLSSFKTKGYFLIALSGSEQYAIEQFTAHYGFDLVSGDRYESRGDNFTGKIDSVFFDKGTALKNIVNEHHLDLKGSVAIGDSHADVTMLEAVERPIVFNPETELFNQAKEYGWPIVIERKNVIYELEPDNNHGYHLKT